MCKLSVKIFVALILSTQCVVQASDVFHVNSKITFYPDEIEEGNYFGYNVLLSDMGLHVGAPKAKNRVQKNLLTGAVFVCSLKNLNSEKVTCQILGNTLKGSTATNDMWFGAQMIATPDNNLMVCAPRDIRILKDFVTSISYDSIQGSCYVYRHSKESIFNPLSTKKYNMDKEKLRYFEIPYNETVRKEYRQFTNGAKKEMRYYENALTGISMSYTNDNQILIGAPGILEFTGSIAAVKRPRHTWNSLEKIVTNPYSTKSLGPNDYLGYSVDSGVFEVNGTLLYVGGAPRSKLGYGQVLIYQPDSKDQDNMDVKAKIRGPQMGGYFGATLCALDLNGDEITDLLVGAPNYATKSDGTLTYDQGAVFVYITVSNIGESKFELEHVGSIQGSEASGAKFGSVIANLGDIDGDGFNDVAIGAPWENDGEGVVYIFQGSEKGLIKKWYQKINAEGAKGFGISISKGYDVDGNNCNDLAVGAHNSGTVYLYRSIPSIQVLCDIMLLEEKNLRQDATNFTAQFCVTVPPNHRWPNVEIELTATVSVDPEGGRAFSTGEPELMITAKPGFRKCDDQIIQIVNNTNMSTPIQLKFDLHYEDKLDETTSFPKKKARLSETSVLSSSLPVQLLSDCGEDLICNPWLEMKIEPLESAPYVPGLEKKLGVRIIVTNVNEPAFGVQLHVDLPCPPKRLDSSCTLKKSKKVKPHLECDLPFPLARNKTAVWEIELEYTWDGAAKQLMVEADLHDPVYGKKVHEGTKNLSIDIVPHSSYKCKGKTETNSTLIIVPREKLEIQEDVLFTHYHEIYNTGPSDAYNVTISFLLSKGVSLFDLMEGATMENDTLTFAPVLLKANTKMAYHLALCFKLTEWGKLFVEQTTWNLTSTMYIRDQFTDETLLLNVTTTLMLEPGIPIWPIIAAVIMALVVLALIMLLLYSLGFFSRQKKEDLKKLMDNRLEEEEGESCGSSIQAIMDNDTTRNQDDTDLEQSYFLVKL